MTELEIKEKNAEYTERQRYWRDKVFNQMSYSINLFLTIGFGLMGFMISQKKDYSNWVIDTSNDFNFSVIFFYITMIITFITIIIGTISVTSRLFDLRLTSHIIKIRKKTLKKFKDVLTDDFPPENKEKPLTKYFEVMFGKDYRISDTEFLNLDFNKIEEKFLYLRGLTRKFGRLSWTTHKIQIGMTLISVLIYGFLIFK